MVEKTSGRFLPGTTLIDIKWLLMAQRQSPNEHNSCDISDYKKLMVMRCVCVYAIKLSL